MNFVPFKTWRIIGKELYQDVRCIPKLLEENCVVGLWAREILEENMIRACKNDLHVVIVSIRELGFETPVPYQEVIQRAKDFDLIVCPRIAGPLICLEYWMEKLSCLRVAMEPVVSRGDYYSTFLIRNIDGKLRLDGGDGSKDSLRLPSDKMIFSLKAP